MFISIFDKEEADKVNRGDMRMFNNVLKDKLEEAKDRLITEKEDARFIAGIAFTLKLILGDLDK